jgi:hypothetical protein
VARSRPTSGPNGNEPPHDTLAAEEFAIPGPDPHSPAAVPADPTGLTEPHDTLAAEAFAIPGPDSRTKGNPPPDPAGIEVPHDTLAAEEFAFPAPDPDAARRAPARSGSPLLVGLAGVVAGALWRYSRRRRRS